MQKRLRHTHTEKFFKPESQFPIANAYILQIQISTLLSTLTFCVTSRKGTLIVTQEQQLPPINVYIVYRRKLVVTAPYSQQIFAYLVQIVEC